MKILGAAIGHCVHVAGIVRFLELAENVGYSTSFLGPATNIDDLINHAKENNPDIIGVSYRLTKESAVNLFQELAEKIKKNGLGKKRWLLGCTASVGEVAKEFGIFEQIFTGFSTDEDVIAFLRGRSSLKAEERYSQHLIARIVEKAPIPLLRHHYGVPSLSETIEGMKTIAESKVLDIISIGPDQNAQECFFRPTEVEERLAGDGGVPIRTEDDLVQLYEVSRTGNYPLLRCYAGTRDLLQWAKILKKTINNAWTATPLTWYSELDGRSKRPLGDAIKENLENIRWHAENNIPVEVNESHQWSLRGAHDSLAVTMAFLAAFNAKALGVQHYIAQYMLNTPLGTSPRMDLAKMFAKIELIEALHDATFTSYREVRPGLLSYPPDLIMGKGQLSASVYTGMQLKPHIIHVVAFCEAGHTASAEEIIESCKIARRVIGQCLLGTPDPLQDKRIIERKEELVQEARTLINALKALGKNSEGNPLTNPSTYVEAVKLGILDTPQFRNHPIAKGKVKTRMIDGACYAVDPSSREPITEEDRMRALDIEVLFDSEKGTFSSTRTETM